MNIKFKLSDGKTRINVTFWDLFAQQFEEALKEDLEHPLILIIASGKISKWRDQIDVCNYSPTKFYLNYDHHSVHQLRKMFNQPNFTQNFSTKRKTLKTCTIDEITKLGTQFTEEEVVCKATIKYVEETRNWTYGVCTSCYHDVQVEEGKNVCNNCPRVVPHPNMKFNISVVASDATGGLQIMLKDREIRSLLGIDVESVEEKDKPFPKILNTIQGKDYTFKLQIKDKNINGSDKVFVATDIYLGFGIDAEVPEEQHSFTNKDYNDKEVSGSSYHIDHLSQLDNI